MRRERREPDGWREPRPALDRAIVITDSPPMNQPSLRHLRVALSKALPESILAYAVVGTLLASSMGWFTVARAREPNAWLESKRRFRAARQVTAENTQTTTRQRMEEVWSQTGTWGGVAWDPGTGRLHASRGSVRAEMDATGAILRESAPLLSAHALRLARFTKGDPAFLAFGVWSQNVTAYGSDGRLIWSYPGAKGTAIDDVWAADLNGDDLDEVIVGFNGGTGMHVLDGNGRLLWKSTDIGNVWHVSAGDVEGKGRSQVVTTSATGRVHVFGVDGKSDAISMRVSTPTPCVSERSPERTPRQRSSQQDRLPVPLAIPQASPRCLVTVHESGFCGLN